ncbi:hypothetical protein ElyMa_000484800 [Elysia marginata]|uniref:Uncharacterized protein n=1 Tax=Elysia marginata TaxID=1093978 RepID=A0AAV4FUU3_9GAST|nr:hypothetical protein ElyMa_000484800 [Elysia marginata]
MALSEAQCLADASNENDILKIISNLPSGWKVVGLTELPQDKGIPLMPRYLAQNVEAHGIEHSNCTKVINSDVCHTGPVKDNSVNNSQAAFKKNCIPITNKDNLTALSSANTSTKTVSNSQTRDEGSTGLCLDKNKICTGKITKNVSNSVDFNVTLPKDHDPGLELKYEENGLASPQIAPELSEPLKHKRQAAPYIPQDVMLPIGNDSKWTVVGITPLPQLEGTGNQSVNFKTTSSNKSSLLSLSDNNKNDSFHHQSQTILKIPHCGYHNPSQPIPHNPNASIATVFQTDSEEMRWTVVGITTSISSSTTPYLMAPQSSLSTTSTVSSSLVSTNKISKTEEIRSANSSLLLPLAHQARVGEQTNLISKTMENLDQNSTLLSPFPQLSSIVSPAIQSQVPNEWRVVGISPIVSTANVLPTLSEFKSDQLLQVPVSSLANDNHLITTSSPLSTATRTSTVQSQPSSLASSPVIDVTNAQVKHPMPTKSPNWHGLVNSLTIGADGLQLKMPTTIPGAEGCLPFLNNVCQGSKSSTMQQDKVSNVDFVPLKDAQSSNWKVVGVVANNQISMLPSEQNQKDNLFKHSGHLVPVPVPALNNSSTSLTACKSKDLMSLPEPYNCNDKNFQYLAVGRKYETDEPAVTTSDQKNLELCLDKRKQELDWNRRAKDMLKKPNASKLKKNTVSSLLKMKRCHSNVSEHPDVQKSQDFHEEELERFIDDIPRKRCRSRSLRSYSGNRQQYEISQDRYESVFTLKSNSDTTFSDANSEEDIEKNQVIKLEKVSPPMTPVKTSEKCLDDVSSHSLSQSPARRRKLKVPRKMVADVDYHPFDSSSDSN